MSKTKVQTEQNKTPSEVLCFCDPSSGEADRQIPGSLASQPCLLGLFQASEILSSKGGLYSVRNTRGCPLASTHMLTLLFTRLPFRQHRNNLIINFFVQLAEKFPHICFLRKYPNSVWTNRMLSSPDLSCTVLSVQTKQFK